MPARKDDREDRMLAEAICSLAKEVCAFRCQINEFCARVAAQLDNQAILERIEQKVDNVMATTAEVIAKLDAAEAQAKKIRTEIQGVQTALNTANAEIVTLKELIAAGGEISPELVASADRLAVALQEADDEIPDFKPTA